jgi:hypothetical protein
MVLWASGLFKRARSRRGCWVTTKKFTRGLICGMVPLAFRPIATRSTSMPRKIAIEIRNSARVLKEQGRSLYEINRLLKLSRNTVRRIVRDGEAAASSPCEPQMLAKLGDALARAGGNVVRVQQLLAEENLGVAYSTLTRWIREAGLCSPRSITASQQSFGRRSTARRLRRGARARLPAPSRF